MAKPRKRRATPIILKKCVTAVLPKTTKKLGQKRGRGAAFGICTKQLRDSGQMRQTGRKLTPRGAGKTSAALRKTSRARIGRDFDSALSDKTPRLPSRKNGGGRNEIESLLEDVVASFPYEPGSAEDGGNLIVAHFVKKARASAPLSNANRSARIKASGAVRASCDDQDSAECRDAIATVMGTGPSSIAGPVECDRWLPVDVLDQYPPENLEIGPFEMMRTHTAGSHPCCFYHPATQERLRLRRWMSEAHREAMQADPLGMIRRFEAQHPLGELWAKCDRDFLGQYEKSMHGARRKGYRSPAKLVRDFVKEARRGGEDAYTAFSQLIRETRENIAVEDALALDSEFIDTFDQYFEMAEQADKRWWEAFRNERHRPRFKRGSGAALRFGR